MRLERVGPPRIRIAIDLSIVTDPLTFAATIAIWFPIGMAGAWALGLIR